MKYFEVLRLIEKKDHLINRLPNLTAEQKAEAIDFFTKHPNYESEIDWNRKDLDWEDFEAVINKDRISKSQLKNFVKEGTYYLRLYTSKDLVIYQPLTWIGSRYLASKDVAPVIEGKWCISYQKDRKFWDNYSFGKKEVFLILCTDTKKFALEISQKGSVNYWDSEDRNITKKEFVQRISSEVSNVAAILKDLVPKAIANFDLVLSLNDRDLKDTKIFEELQKKAEEEKIKAFQRSFSKQVAKKGYYEWEGDLKSEDIKKYGLISEDGKHLDERIKYFRVKGKYVLNELPIEEAIWPLAIESGKFSMGKCSRLSSVIIPNGITSIGDYAFYGCKSLAEAIIPDSVESIGYGAFADCSSLTSVIIPDSVTSIGDSAFYNCLLLKEVTISENVTSIGYRVFYYCSSLTEITIPDSVTSIGSSAFNGCTSLKSVIIGNNVISIGRNAFYECKSLTSIAIPNSVTEIDVCAFSNCTSLKSVTIGNSVKSINLKAFEYCTSLAEITIPDSVTFIGWCVFLDCKSLKSVTLGDSVESIGDRAFYDCTSLTEITIPDSVTSIGSNAFSYCTSLKSATIGNSVTSVGDWAFFGCSSLESIYIDQEKDSLDISKAFILSTVQIYWKGEF